MVVLLLVLAVVVAMAVVEWDDANDAGAMILVTLCGEINGVWWC